MNMDGQPTQLGAGSEVWNYFTIVTFGNEHKTRCSVCNYDLAYTPGITGTSAMRQHLIQTHEIPLRSQARTTDSRENDAEIPMDESGWEDLVPDGRRSKKSKVWNFFRLIEHGEERYSRCTICRGDLKYYGSTTAMWHHLRAKHHQAYERGYPTVAQTLDGGDGDGDLDLSASGGIGNDGDASPKKVDSLNRQHRGSSGMGRSKSSVVWKFFKVVYFGPDKRTRCDLCKADMAYHDGTTAMHKHLERKHPREYEQGERLQGMGFKQEGEAETEDAAEDDVEDEYLASLDNVGSVFGLIQQPDTNTTKTPSRASKETRQTLQDNSSTNTQSKPLKASLSKDTIKSLLRESIANLCREKLQFDSEISVEALIGFTVDKKEVILVNINETLQPEEDSAAAPPAASTRAQKRSAQAQPNSSKKKSKRARGGRPSRAAAQKDTQMSLEMESYDAADDDDETWEPGGGGGGVKTKQPPTRTRTRRTRKRISYREAHDEENDSDETHDDGAENPPDLRDSETEQDGEVAVKQEQTDWNTHTKHDRPEPMADESEGVLQTESSTTDSGNKRVDMAVKSCVICGKIYMATEHLNHHMVVQHGLGDKQAKSPQTGATSQQKSQSQQEAQAAPDSSNQPGAASKEQPVRCKYCLETLSADQLVTHFDSLHPGEDIQYECWQVSSAAT